ncbi:hypothetical protein D0C16_05410 [Cellvibrio sp. KY-GH-1]|uniref:hypothetical protein n=1 Tax=Cellvibrio sp. KY-GH-1 TaxID=2303332 RepID=UPI001245A919|nr:hypothetical protein [Cellvibrio sp. KY-GH-1]QEY15460.1 hypothetical protein D0C16_05410 [Cellvibrio sp. KY-GH-1]
MAIALSALVSSDDKIGVDRSFTDKGTSFFDIDGSEWLRSGSLALASSYPEAAGLDFLKCLGSAGFIADPLNISDVATNFSSGGGIVIVCNGSSTLRVSVNGGLTFVDVVLSGNVDSVSYSPTLDVWVAVGNSSSQWFAWSQTTANITSAWTSRTAPAVSSSSATALVRWCGTAFVAGCAGSTTAGSIRSTDGTSWLAANFATIFSGRAKIAFDGVATVLIAGSSGAGSVNRSTNTGAAFSSVSLPISSVVNISFCFGKFVGLYATNNGSLGLIHSVNGAAASWTDRGNVFQLAGWAGNISGADFDGARLCVPVGGSASSGAAFLYTADPNFNSWKIKYSAVNFSSASNLVYRGGGGKSVAVASNNSLTLISADFNTPVYIGYPLTIRSSPQSASDSGVSYTKIAE